LQRRWSRARRYFRRCARSRNPRLGTTTANASAARSYTTGQLANATHQFTATAMRPATPARPPRRRLSRSIRSRQCSGRPQRRGQNSTNQAAATDTARNVKALSDSFDPIIPAIPAVSTGPNPIMNGGCWRWSAAYGCREQGTLLSAQGLARGLTGWVDLSKKPSDSRCFWDASGVGGAPADTEQLSPNGMKSCSNRWVRFKTYFGR
jgi:hypothetical protein